MSIYSPFLTNPIVQVPIVQVPIVKVPIVKVPIVQVPNVKVPIVKVPNVKVPIVKVPIVQVPIVKVPIVQVPIIPMYLTNEIKSAILNNDPIDNVLHVIAVVSNPCQYQRRYSLAKQFIERMEHESNIILYIVELAYNDQSFQLTNSKCKRHLQLRTNSPPLWVKENMINIGVNKLFPNNWKAMAWIDADVEFENADWAMDCLKVLNGCRDIVQLFSHAVDMDFNQDAMNVFAGFGFQYTKQREYTKKNVLKMWHPGYTVAMTRKAWNQMGNSTYETSILGAGDHNLMLCLIGKGCMSLSDGVHPDYLESVLDFQKKVKGLRLGYIPGVIRHYFHGTKANRKYVERWQILVKNNYSPKLHITKDDLGLLVPTKQCPQNLIDQIYNYFSDRDEDYTVAKLQIN